MNNHSFGLHLILLIVSLSVFPETRPFGNGGFIALHKGKEEGLRVRFDGSKGDESRLKRA